MTLLIGKKSSSFEIFYFFIITFWCSCMALIFESRRITKQLQKIQKVNFMKSLYKLLFLHVVHPVYFGQLSSAACTQKLVKTLLWLFSAFFDDFTCFSVIFCPKTIVNCIPSAIGPCMYSIPTYTYISPIKDS